MVAFALGYYTDGDVWFHIGAEPPLDQFVLRDGAWVPLPDGFYLADRLMGGDVDLDGPFVEPPEGMPSVSGVSR